MSELNPGQTNIAANDWGPLGATDNILPDKDTPLEDIEKAYHNVGKDYAQIVQNAKTNVGERQQQLVGNNFGAVNPYMENTYYEDATSGFLSQMRVDGTTAAMKEGLQRESNAAKEAAENAQKNYQNKLAAAQKAAQQKRQTPTLAYADGGFEGTSAAEVMNYDQAKNMSEKDISNKLNAAATDSKGLVQDWNIKEKRTEASQAVADSLGMTLDEVRAQGDDFWRRDDVTEVWTKTYTNSYLNEFYGAEAATQYQQNYEYNRGQAKKIFDFIHGVSNSIDQWDKWIKKELQVATINLKGVNKADQFENSGVDSSNMDVMIKGNKFSYNANNLVSIEGIAISNDKLLEMLPDDKKYLVSKLEDVMSRTFDDNNPEYVQYSNELRNAVFKAKYNRDDVSVKKGGAEFDVETLYDSVDVLLENAFGFDYKSMKDISKLEKEDPDRYNRILDQYARSMGTAETFVYADGKTEYNTPDGPKVLDEGTLVMWVPEGADQDESLQDFLKTYKKLDSINENDDEALEEAQNAIEESYEKYMKHCRAASMMAAYYDTPISKAVFGAVLWGDDPEKYADVEILEGKTAQAIIDEFKGEIDKDGNKAYKTIGKLIYSVHNGDTNTKIMVTDDKKNLMSLDNKTAYGENTLDTTDEKTLYDDLNRSDQLAVLAVITESARLHKEGVNQEGNINFDWVYGASEKGQWGDWFQELGENLVDTFGIFNEGLNVLVSGAEEFMMTAFGPHEWKDFGDNMMNEKDHMSHTVNLVDEIGQFLTNGNTYESGTLNDRFHQQYQEGYWRNDHMMRDLRYENLSAVVSPMIVAAWGLDKDYNVRKLHETAGIENVAEGVRGISAFLIPMVVGNKIQGKMFGGMSAAVKDSVGQAADNISMMARSKAFELSLDDIARGAINLSSQYGDDVAKAAGATVANSADDVAKAAAKGASMSADDVARLEQSAINQLATGNMSAKDFVKATAANSVDDAAKATNLTTKAVTKADDLLNSFANNIDKMNSRFLQGYNAGKFGYAYADDILKNPAVKGAVDKLSKTERAALRDELAKVGGKLGQRSVQTAYVKDALGLSAKDLRNVSDSALNAISQMLLVSSGDNIAGEAMSKALRQSVLSMGDDAVRRVAKDMVQKAKDMFSHGLVFGSDEAVRFLASNGFDGVKGRLFMKAVIDDYIPDLIRDVYFGYKQPVATNEGLENRTLEEYIADPSGFLFNLGMSFLQVGGGRVLTKARLGVANHNLAKAMGELAEVTGVANNPKSVKLAQKVAKLSSKVASLSDKAFEKGLNYGQIQKATEVAGKAEKEAWNNLFGTDANGNPTTTFHMTQKQINKNIRTNPEFCKFFAEHRIDNIDGLMDAQSLSTSKAMAQYLVNFKAMGGDLGGNTLINIGWDDIEGTNKSRPNIQGMMAADKARIEFMSTPEYQAAHAKIKTHKQAIAMQRKIYGKMADATIEAMKGYNIDGLDAAVRHFYNNLADKMEEGLANGDLTLNSIRYGYEPLGALFDGNYTATLNGRGLHSGMGVAEHVVLDSANQFVARDVWMQSDVIDALYKGEKDISYIFNVSEDGIQAIRARVKDGIIEAYDDKGAALLADDTQKFLYGDGITLSGAEIKEMGDKAPQLVSRTRKLNYAGSNYLDRLTYDNNSRTFNQYAGKMLGNTPNDAGAAAVRTGNFMVVSREAGIAAAEKNRALYGDRLRKLNLKASRLADADGAVEAAEKAEKALLDNTDPEQIKAVANLKSQRTALATQIENLRSKVNDVPKGVDETSDAFKRAKKDVAADIKKYKDGFLDEYGKTKSYNYATGEESVRADYLQYDAKYVGMIQSLSNGEPQSMADVIKYRMLINEDLDARTASKAAKATATETPVENKFATIQLTGKDVKTGKSYNYTVESTNPKYAIVKNGEFSESGYSNVRSTYGHILDQSYDGNTPDAIRRAYSLASQEVSIDLKDQIRQDVPFGLFEAGALYNQYLPDRMLANAVVEGGNKSLASTMAKVDNRMMEGQLIDMFAELSNLSDNDGIQKAAAYYYHMIDAANYGKSMGEFDFGKFDDMEAGEGGYKIAFSDGYEGYNPLESRMTKQPQNQYDFGSPYTSYSANAEALGNFKTIMDYASGNTKTLPDAFTADEKAVIDKFKKEFKSRSDQYFTIKNDIEAARKELGNIGKLRTPAPFDNDLIANAAQRSKLVYDINSKIADFPDSEFAKYVNNAKKHQPVNLDAFLAERDAKAFNIKPELYDDVLKLDATTPEGANRQLLAEFKANKDAVSSKYFAGDTKGIKPETSFNYDEYIGWMNTRADGKGVRTMSMEDMSVTGHGPEFYNNISTPFEMPDRVGSQQQLMRIISNIDGSEKHPMLTYEGRNAVDYFSPITEYGMSEINGGAQVDGVSGNTTFAIGYDANGLNIIIDNAPDDIPAKQAKNIVDDINTEIYKRGKEMDYGVFKENEIPAGTSVADSVFTDTKGTSYVLVEYRKPLLSEHVIEDPESQFGPDSVNDIASEAYRESDNKRMEADDSNKYYTWGIDKKIRDRQNKFMEYLQETAANNDALTEAEKLEKKLAALDNKIAEAEAKTPKNDGQESIKKAKSRQTKRVKYIDGDGNEQILDIDMKSAKKYLNEDEFNAIQRYIDDLDDIDVYLRGDSEIYIDSRTGMRYLADGASPEATAKVSSYLTVEDELDLDKMTKEARKQYEKADKKKTKAMQKKMNQGKIISANKAAEFGIDELDRASRGATYANWKGLSDLARTAADNELVNYDNMIVSEDYMRMMTRISQSSLKEPGAVGQFFNNCTEFAQWFQNFQLAGGAAGINALSIVQLRDAIMTNPAAIVDYVKAFANMKNDAATRRFVLENYELLVKTTMQTGDQSLFGDLGKAVSSKPGVDDGGDIQKLIYNLQNTGRDYKRALAEYEGKKLTATKHLGAFKDIVSKDIDTVLSDKTFQNVMPVMRVVMLNRNYKDALKLAKWKFPDMADEAIDSLAVDMAYAKTQAFFNPYDAFTGALSNPQSAIQGNGFLHTAKFSGFIEADRAAKLDKFQADFIGAETSNTILDKLSSCFFALRYKMTLAGRAAGGFLDVIDAPADIVKMAHRVHGEATEGAINDLGGAFMRSGGQQYIASMGVIVGLAALSQHASGVPMAWDDLTNWTDSDGNFKVPDVFMKFQTLGQIMLPGFDVNEKSAVLDPLSSTFTLQNSLFKCMNRIFNPDAYYNAPQRGGILSFLGNAVGMDTNTGIFAAENAFMNNNVVKGISEEIIGSNLLSPFKAVYELVTNSSYFGNNLWEKKYISEGVENPNYDPARNMIAGVQHLLGLDMYNSVGNNSWVKGKYLNQWAVHIADEVDNADALFSGKYDTSKLKEGDYVRTRDTKTYYKWQPYTKTFKAMGSEGDINKDYVYQDNTGTVSGSGFLQHEYASGLIDMISKGNVLEAITEAGELPIKFRNYSSDARNDFNNTIKNTMIQYMNEYKKEVEDAPDVYMKDVAYAKAVKKCADLVANWSKKYGFVLGENQDLVPYVTKTMMAICAGEYNDVTQYVQNAYNKASDMAKIMQGESLFISLDKDANGNYTDETAAKLKFNGISDEDIANEANRRSEAYNQAIYDEYLARKAMKDAGIDNEYINSFSMKNFEARDWFLNKQIHTEVIAKLEGPVGNYKNFAAMKKVYENRIENTNNKNQKVALANEYNQYVTDILAPYVNKYGASVINDVYYNRQNFTKTVGDYIIIPYGQNYKDYTYDSGYTQTAGASYLKDLFGVGYKNRTNLPSDKDAVVELNAAVKQMMQGNNARVNTMLKDLRNKVLRGELYVSDEDYSRILNLSAAVSARS